MFPNTLTTDSVCVLGRRRRERELLNCLYFVAFGCCVCFFNSLSVHKHTKMNA